MTKTVSVTLENPITAIRKRFAKRKIQKLQKQIDKRQEKISMLNEKFFKDSTTEILEKKTESKEIQKMRTLDNKIIFEENKSGNLNATKGRIDEAIEKIKALEIEPKCVKISKVPFGERKGKYTLFVNVNSKFKGTPLNKKHTKNLLEKLGYEVVLN